jgi:hypothetical protein
MRGCSLWAKPVGANYIRDRSRLAIAPNCSILLTLTMIALSGCATRPRIVEVSSTTRRNMVERIDEDIFLHDPASKMHVANAVLPVNEQREEFFVRWRPRTIDEVRFEYRQVNVPEKIILQSFKTSDEAAHVFAVRGEEFLNGGPVSAWRVSLWQNDQLVAERNSVLW